MKLYYHPASRASRVRWALEEVGADYELIRVGPGLDRAAYLQVHPLAQIPALTVGDRHFFETGAICLYLADRFGRFAPSPDDHEARGQFYSWMFFAMTELDRWTAEVHLHKGNPLPAEAARGEFARRARVVADRLASRPFMLGSDFSMVDLLVASVLGWASALGLLGDFPSLETYRAKMESRPAAVRSRAE